MTTTSKPFTGLVPAVVLPMTDDARIDEAALRGYAHWLLGHEGLAGVAVNADTGEGPHLTPAERRRVLEIWVEESAGRVPVVAGIGGPSTEAALAGARDAREAGADALLVFPIPAYLGQPLDPEIPVRYHSAIYEAAALPMVLFQLQPALGGVLFDDACLKRLLAMPGVAAIKEASFDAMDFVRVRDIVREHAPHVTFLTGNDNFIFESFVLGAEGALIGFGTLAVSEQIAMIRAAQAGDWESAERYNRVVGPLAAAIFAPPVRDYRARTKAALHIQGVIPGTSVRPPLLPLSCEALEAVRSAIGNGQ